MYDVTVCNFFSFKDKYIYGITKGEERGGVVGCGFDMSKREQSLS